MKLRQFVALFSAFAAGMSCLSMIDAVIQQNALASALTTIFMFSNSICAYINMEASE